ncbi:MAG: hypothetical protein AAF125_24870, partial [Chloroflexota bacterium]
MSPNSDFEKIDAFWSNKSRSQTKQLNSNQHLIVRWWQHDYIVQQINERVCGTPVRGFSAGLITRLKNTFPDRLPVERAISIGSGAGVKEMTLLEQGLVMSFDLFELSSFRIGQGKKIAKDRGLSDRIN